MSPSTAVRPLLLVLAVLGLLGTGGVEPATRSGSTPAAAVAAGSVARSALSQRADTQAPGAVLRPGLAPASTPTPGGVALGPPHAPTLAAHLGAGQRDHVPGRPHLSPAWSPQTGRAPPVTTGT